MDSVFYPTVLADTAEAEKSDGVEITYADGRRYERDTAYLTAKKIVERYGVGGLKMRIEKGIPEGAGLGGSSVDAGLAARAMQALYNLPEIDPELLLSVGSDVPYFVQGGAKRVRGLGERIEEVVLPRLYGVILVPDSGVDTGACYRLYDEIGGENGSTEEFLKQAKRDIRPFNALQQAGERLNGKVSEGLRILKEAGFAACMTGSGSATFGVTTDEAAYRLRKKKAIESAYGFTIFEI